MDNWMLTKIKCFKQLDNGSMKRVTEQYLFQAYSFTDCETSVYDKLGQSIRGEFVVDAIARYTVHDIFKYDDIDTWWKIKLTFTGINDDDGKEKLITQEILVTANTSKEAYERVKESIDTTALGDYEMPSILKTPIIEIFPLKDQ